MMFGHEETVKLRQDVKDYTVANDNKSCDLFTRLFATLEEMKVDSKATTSELNQLRADNRENRTYASAAAGNRTPNGARWTAPEDQGGRGTPMDGAGEEKGGF